jgi:phosphohistidine phosphatase
MMPKTVLLMRHGQAGGGASGGDFNRRLTDHGRAQAAAVGRWLVTASCVPDRLLVSAAMRAVQTAEICAAAAGFSGALERHQSLYGAGPDQLIQAIAKLPSDQAVMVVAHNPGLAQLTAFWSRNYQPFPAASIAVFSFRPGKDIPDLVAVRTP